MMSLEDAMGLPVGHQVWFYLGLTPLQAVVTVVATAIIYIFFLVLTRIMGQRLLMKLSSVDVLVVVVMGAILGRAMMGHVPTVGTAIIVMLTLVVLEITGSRVSRSRRFERFVSNEPVVIMAHGQALPEQMRRCHVSPAELQSRLRIAGITRFAQVAAVVVERTGELAVLREGEAIDPDMLSGVRGGDLVVGRGPAAS